MTSARGTKAFDLTAEMAAAAAAAAQPLGVFGGLRDHDQLIGYLISHLKWQPEVAATNFIHHGRNDALKIEKTIQRLALLDKPSRILEFACGYGRVSRHLKGLTPKCVYVASDIHQEACDFVEGSIGVPTRVSSYFPDKLDVGDSYDFVFVLSLFSHLPEEAFKKWLRSLIDILSPGAYLLFTTHGHSALDNSGGYFASFLNTETGFGFKSDDTDQTDLESVHYGTTISLPRFVTKVLSTTVPDAELISFTSNEWFGTQDEWLVRKKG